jgi:hypothetical protein
MLRFGFMEAAVTRRQVMLQESVYQMITIYPNTDH